VLFFSIKLRKFWHTARLSRTNRHKVIKSENSPVFWPTLYNYQNYHLLKCDASYKSLYTVRRHRMHAVNRCGLLLQMQRGLCACMYVDWRVLVGGQLGTMYQLGLCSPTGSRTLRGRLITRALIFLTLFTSGQQRCGFWLPILKQVVRSHINLISCTSFKFWPTVCCYVYQCSYFSYAMHS